MNADPRIAEIAKALDAWEFDSFGNTREEHWEAAAEIALRIADAAYERIGWRNDVGSYVPEWKNARDAEYEESDIWEPVYVQRAI